MFIFIYNSQWLKNWVKCLFDMYSCLELIFKSVSESASHGLATLLSNLDSPLVMSSKDMLNNQETWKTIIYKRVSVNVAQRPVYIEIAYR